MLINLVLRKGITDTWFSLEFLDEVALSIGEEETWPRSNIFKGMHQRYIHISNVLKKQLQTKMKIWNQISNLILNSYPSRYPHIQSSYRWGSFSCKMGVGCVWIVWVFGWLEVFSPNTRAAPVICFVHTFSLFMVKANGLYANCSAGPKVLFCRTNTSPQPHSDLRGANMQ